MLGLGTAEVADLFGEQCVTARVAEGNIASTKALKRRGFEYLGEHNGLNVYSRCHESGCDQPDTAHSRAVVHLHRL
ncbi:hypothetical protein BIV04_01610 [Frigoribacterium sp. MCBA15_019]|nr:hypothetical protein BIV04_01610 [Frigoribacterium sp. MCBA15_019]